MDWWPPAGRPGSCARNGIPCREVFKVHEGRPHVVDLIENGEIQLVLNTPLGPRLGIRREGDPRARGRARRAGDHHRGRRAGRGVGDGGAARGPLDVSALQEIA